MFPARIPGRARARGVGRLLQPLALALLACLGCAEGRSLPDFGGGARRPGPEAITVDVANDNYHDVVVYVEGGAGWQRLGTVTGLCRVELQVTGAFQSAASSYAIRVHAIGTSDSEDYYSGTLFADPGDLIELTVASVLSLSSWTVRGRDAS